MNRRQPLVSVVIPCFNSSGSVKKALSSLVLQTYSHWEAIVIDDGSTDNTAEIICQIQDKRIKYFPLGLNLGRGVARQKGLEEAKGKYLAMIDSDDWIPPHKLEMQVNYLENNKDVTLVASKLGILNKENNLIGVKYGNHFLNRKIIFKKLNHPKIPHACSMIRMEEAKKFRYDHHLQLSQDSDFLIRLMLGKTYCVLDNILYYYTEISSRNPAKIKKALRYSYKIYLKHFSKHPIVVFWIVMKMGFKALAYTLLIKLNLLEELHKKKCQILSVKELNDYRLYQKRLTTFLER